jgi:hypothetical protein
MKKAKISMTPAEAYFVWLTTGTWPIIGFRSPASIRAAVLRANMLNASRRGVRNAAANP